MTSGNNIGQYSLEQALFARVLVAGKSVKIRPRKDATKNSLVALRQRCYTFRVKDRERNASIFDTDHPLHGRSHYDTIKLTVESDEQGPYLRAVVGEVAFNEDFVIEEDGIADDMDDGAIPI